jgi:hypothetical protein
MHQFMSPSLVKLGDGPGAAYYAKLPENTGHTQKNGAVSKVNSFETAPFFCACPVYSLRGCLENEEIEHGVDLSLQNKLQGAGSERKGPERK